MEDNLTTERFRQSITSLVDSGYITVCPNCGAESKDYYCRKCKTTGAPERMSKEDYIVDRAIWFFSGSF